MLTFYPPVNRLTPSQLAPNCDLPSHYRWKNAPCKMAVRSIFQTSNLQLFRNRAEQKCRDGCIKVAIRKIEAGYIHFQQFEIP